MTSRHPAVVGQSSVLSDNSLLSIALKGAVRRFCGRLRGAVLNEVPDAVAGLPAQKDTARRPDG